jgi:hypothetical protein
VCLPEQEATRLRGVVETESAARGQQQQEAVAAQATRDHYRTTSRNATMLRRGYATLTNYHIRKNKN